MADKKHILLDSTNQPVTILVRRDKRLKKSSRYTRQPDGSILLRIPYRLPKSQVGGLLDKIAVQLQKQAVLAERRTDLELQQRAGRINKRYFHGKIQWQAIRWVGNMDQRLGSCTNGGATDGHIRISARIKGWPDWVVDYVIAHELVHRLHPNHSQAFWDTLRSGYPLVERARGFIQGIGYDQGIRFDED